MDVLKIKKPIEMFQDYTKQWLEKSFPDNFYEFLTKDTHEDDLEKQNDSDEEEEI
mgnify:CR=1 FL=1